MLPPHIENGEKRSKESIFTLNYELLFSLIICFFYFILNEFIIYNNRYCAGSVALVFLGFSLRQKNGQKKKNLCTSAPQNFAADDLISVLAPRATNCPDKSIPNAEERHREASPDILKGSRLIRVSASTNREERNDSGKRWR